MTTAPTHELTNLQWLEAESIHIFREVAAEFERPVLLFSGGKDSVVMLHLAAKSFAPAKIPFPVMHVDTGHNFQEVLDFRDRTVQRLGVRLVVGSVEESIAKGRVRERPDGIRNPLQTVTLLDAITEGGYDAVFGGARRDEEKARAKERVFSFRDEFGQWDPKNQRPELWNLYNGRHHKGEHIRVFPLSNWTELDVWQYIADQRIELPPIYFAHEREVFRRDNMWLSVGPHVQPREGEEVVRLKARFRTVGDAHTNLALLTDGLRAEREQGITIDVAYRYFATPKRKFIIADTPGHIQYTRNMVTGASTANLALILIDARKGILEQSRRHAFISSLLGIPHLVLCINKMDLVDYDEGVFEAIRQEFRQFAMKLDVSDLTFIPISALHGDNVVERSANTPWYEGSSLLHHLEEVHIAPDRNLIDCRFPVQYVIRPRDDNHHDYRGYAGQVASGSYKVGDDVVLLPSGFTSTVASIDTADG